MLLWEALFILVLTTLNVLFSCWDTRLRQTEMRTRVEWLHQFLNEWGSKCEWGPEIYPHIHSPQSPSITLQPTLRDGNVVNLPWALLVKGDVIVLRPGQPAPGRCKNLKVLYGIVFSKRIPWSYVFVDSRSRWNRICFGTGRNLCTSYRFGQSRPLQYASLTSAFAMCLLYPWRNTLRSICSHCFERSFK